MTKKNDKNILKDQIEDTELYVRTARTSFDDIRNMMTGAINILKWQGIITENTDECLQRYLARLDTQVNKIEIEYYKLKDIAKKGLR